MQTIRKDRWDRRLYFRAFIEDRDWLDPDWRPGYPPEGPPERLPRWAFHGPAV